MEISYKAKLKELQDQLEDCKKELKCEQDRVEKLVESLYKLQVELDKVFE